MAGQLARREAGAMPLRIVTDEATPPDALPRPCPEGRGAFRLLLRRAARNSIAEDTATSLAPSIRRKLYATLLRQVLG